MAKKVVLGCELNEIFLQVSFAAEGGRASSLHMPSSNKLLQMPLSIAREKGGGSWAYGEDAYKVRNRGGDIAEDLYSHLGQTIRIAGDMYTYEELLGLFFGHMCRMARHACEEALNEDVDIVAVVISAEPFPEKAQQLIKNCFRDSSIGQVFLQGHEESLFSYLIHQPERLLGYVTGVLDLTGENMTAYCMEVNPRTSPVVVTIERDEETGIVKKKHYPTIMEHDQALSEMDGMLADYVARFTEGKIVTSMYLVGDGFAKDWYPQSRKVLCKNRKVFAGNNLFSKGAAFSAAEHIWPGNEKEDFLFLGRDMLRYNIGMQVAEGSSEGYLPLLDAGVSWYEAKCETEILLETADEIRLFIQPISGGGNFELAIPIGEEEQRPGRAYRYLLRVEMIGRDTLQCTLQDEGFGQIYPPKTDEIKGTFQLDQAVSRETN